MEMLWPLLALGFSFCGAVIVGFNHWAKLDSTRLIVLRGAGVVPVALLAWLVVPWPAHGDFYVAAAAMGVLIAFSDILLFKAASTHGGRLAALYIPMKMLLGFVVWGLIAPSSVTALAEDWWRMVLVLAGFGLCSGALFSLRKQDASWAGLVAVAPVAVLLALGDVVAKYALNTSADGLLAVVGSAVAFVTTTTTMGTVVGLVLIGVKHRRFAMPTRREVVLSAAFGALLLASLSVLLVALAIAPNPGYVGAVTMLSALWLAIHGYIYHGERANWWSGVALLAGAVAVAVGSV
ncbi:MAG: hypothetical protein EON60_10510 [Alphaproteobacteria bacterium]|nr:MAG: hypothetical protein EON60_10510 [Alphaproteobacteria bacterium]